MTRTFLLILGVFLALACGVLIWSWLADAYTTGGDIGVFVAYAAVAVVIAAAVSFIWSKWRQALLPIVLVLLSVGCTRVDPGWEGIKVDMLGGNRGEAYPIVTGRVWFNPWTEDIYEFPTFLQRVVWTAQEGEGNPENDESFTFRSKEGWAFNVDVGMGLRFIQGKTPQVFVKYRRTAAEIIDGPFRDVVREAFVSAGSQMEGLQILGAGMTQLNQTATEIARTELGDLVTVEYVNVVGKPRVDSQVEGAINAVVQAQQQANEAEAQVRTKEAQARQQVATATGNAESLLINARAKADAIRIEAEALRTFGAQVIQMRAIEKWNGTMPIVTGSGAMPFISVPTN